VWVGIGLENIFDQAPCDGWLRTIQWTRRRGCPTHASVDHLPTECAPISQIETPAPKSSSKRTHGSAATAFVLITVLLDVMALGMMLPALPKLVEAFIPDDKAQAARIYGLLGMSWGLMQLVGAPFLGAVSDQYGRRPVILFSNLGLGLDYLLMALAPNLWVLFVGRIIAGFTSAAFATAFAYIADVHPEDKRATEFGKMGAMFGLGFIAGPAIGGLLSGIDPRLPFWVASVLSLLNFVYGYFVLPESLAPERRMPFSWARANAWGSLRLLGSTPRLLGLSAVSIIDSLVLVSLPATFVLYATHKFNWTDQTIGLTYAAIGVGLAIVHGLLTGPVVAWLGERRTLLVGLAFGTAGFAMYGVSWAGWVIWASIPLIALWGFADSAMQSLMSAEVGPGQQGQLQGALASLMAVAETIGPILFTQVYAAAISTQADWAPAGAPFLVAAALQLGGLFIARWCTRRPGQA
jgi:MFS transporter, DHA1 family, tetracycline resistance protein